MRLLFYKSFALLTSFLAAAAAPAFADPEEGEPPEYIYRNYKPIEAEQTIKNCWDQRSRPCFSAMIPPRCRRGMAREIAGGPT